MTVKILEQFFIAPDEKGRYRSFPTSALLNDRTVLITYRDASWPGKKPPKDFGEHGLGGDIYFTKWNLKSRKITQPAKIYNHRKTGSNEQATILTRGANGLYLFTRQFGKSFQNHFSFSKKGERPLRSRTPVTPEKLAFVASHGRLREWKKRLIAPIYGIAEKARADNRRLGSGWIFCDQKDYHWKFGGWIARPQKEGPSFNETAILPIKNNRWLALIRSGEDKERLYQCHSRKGLDSWGTPRYSGFRGEAPELYQLEKGIIALSYRGFLREKGKYSWSLRLSGDEGESWSSPFHIDRYDGSRFHGGYGDLTPLGKNLWLAVCYSPGPSGFPGIRGAILEFRL